MTTVRQLIDSLMMCEDLDSPVIYEYYLKDHFEHTGVDDEQWAEVVDQLDNILTNDDSYSMVVNAIKGAQLKPAMEVYDLVDRKEEAK